MLPAKLYHPAPNATLLRVFSADESESGGDLWNDEEAGPAGGDTTPNETVSFSGSAGAFIKDRSVRQDATDGGSDYLRAAIVTVPQAVGSIAVKDKIELIRDGATSSEVWSVASVDNLLGDPLCPLWRIRTRED